MLETEIKNNTAAIGALAAAIGALAAALRVQNPAAAPAPASMPPVNPVPAAAAPAAAPAAPVTPAPAPVAAPAPVTPAPAPVAAPAPVTPAGGMDTNVPSSVPVAPAPASMPPVNPVPAAAAPAPAPAISGDDLRKLCVKAGAAGLTAEVVQFLSDHGVAKLAALPPADYPALVALLKSKGVE